MLTASVHRSIDRAQSIITKYLSCLLPSSPPFQFSFVRRQNEAETRKSIQEAHAPLLALLRIQAAFPDARFVPSQSRNIFDLTPNPPFFTPVDAETCVMAVTGKLDLVKQLATVLQGEVKPSEFVSLPQPRSHQRRDSISNEDTAKPFCSDHPMLYTRTLCQGQSLPRGR